MNCRLCRAQVEEVGTRERQSEEIGAHLESCASCQSFYREQVALKNLIGELATVSAPHDFNLQLRARLNTSREAKSRPVSFGEKLKVLFAGGYRFAPSAFSIALAACFTLTVGAALWLNYAGRKVVLTETTAKKIESPETIKATQRIAQISNDTSAGVRTSKRAENKTAAVNAKTRNGTSVTAPLLRRVTEQKLNAVETVASTSANALHLMLPVTPREIKQSANFSATAAPPVVKAASVPTDLQNVNSTAAGSVNVSPPNEKDNARQNAKTIRAALGFEGAPLQNSHDANAKWGSFLISRVAPESIAARGGLQAGDVIETINGHPASEILPTLLTAEAQVGTSHALSLRVVRNGKPLELAFIIPAQ